MPFVMAAVIACAFIALVAIASALGDDAALIQEAQGDEGLSLARLTAGFVLVGVPALTAWGISINHRCINAVFRRVLMTLDVLMGVWLCAACVITIEFDISEPPIVAIAVVSDLLIALFVESYIDARIFPSIHRYRALFHRLPLDLRIMNDGGRVIFKTDMARPLDNTTLWRMSQLAPASPTEIAEMVPAHHSDSMPDTAFKLYRLSAGSALLTEDASMVNQLRERLKERQEQLTAQNEILRRNHAMQSLLYRQQRERELYERVERDLATTAGQISRILDNRIVGQGPFVREERRKQLNLVKVLVAYSKRKGMLALLAAESDTMTEEQIGLVAREAMADLHSIGIECAILVDSGEPIAIDAFNTMYDCFYDCVLSVLPRADPVVMTFIKTRDASTLEMRANIECAMGLSDEDENPAIPQIAGSTDTWTAMQMGIARDLEGRLAMRRCDYHVTLDEGLVNVTVKVVAPAPDGQPSRMPQAGDR